ncbi:Armadillo repeat-containing protein 2 [Collichthys lucidus]|uniref:Armadillo repeat-containing protein 2 n=1 Tax=Collichthys lucidus TaxID=240159 RepID=A0A4U5UL33_COLLU|nr:Armadillo repeat-containing protein 2 [Collichthys lucidus]
MASMERKHDVCSPFVPRRSSVRKTSAEIVSEARQSLRVPSTQRPFTPRDGHRQLFGNSSVRADRDNRPPSTFSLHAQNFDAPDSRPGSGTRLSPLDHDKSSCQLNDSPVETTPGVAVVLTNLGHAEQQVKEPRNGNNATSPEEDAESLVWNNMIAPLLQQLESVSAGGSEGSVDRLCDLCDALYGTLAEANMLGRCCKRRSGILRTLFRLIDLNSAQLNLHIAKLCLALCVSGKNLLNICKLIFQISRSESNDILFQNNSIIDLFLGILSNEDVSASGEALLYCVGTLKFLSGNSAILRLLLDKNCIGVAQKLIQRLCTADDTNFTIAGHILVQLTATLRNLADHPDSRPLFISFSILPELCVVLRHHHKDQDICTNISRIYSKLSSYSECRLALAQTPDCYQLFLELLSKHHQKQREVKTSFSNVHVTPRHVYPSEQVARVHQVQAHSRDIVSVCTKCFLLLSPLCCDLVVRLLFTLGNLTAKSDEARRQLFQCEGCTGTLLQLYDSYQRRDDSAHTPTRKGPPPSPNRPPAPPACVQEHDDVLVKLVRVLANMCIHPAVGPALATNTACIQLLMETLGCAASHYRVSKEGHNKAAFSVRTRNRIQCDTSCWLTPTAISSIYDLAHDICCYIRNRLGFQVIAELTSVQESEELLVNVAATVNNMSFYQEDSSVLRLSRLTIAKLMLKLVLSSSMDAMLEATRVYGNLSQSKDVRDFIMQNKVHQFVVTLLDSKSTEMCFSACGVLTNLALDPPNRALWNMIGSGGGGGSEEKLMDTQEKESLLEILITYLDEEEALKWIENEDLRDYHKACWELEFQPVAQKLMKTLQPSDRAASQHTKTWS